MNNEGRTLLRETTRIGQCFQLSSCLLNPEDCITHLQNKIEKSQSEDSKQKIRSKLNLLCELMVVNYMPFDLAFEEYVGMLNDSSVGNMNNKRQSFVDAILRESSGIPCMIVNVENSRHLLLLENSGSESHYRMFKALGEIFNKKKEKELDKLSQQFPYLMKLFNGQRDRAVAITMLTFDNSITSISNKLGIREDVILAIKSNVLQACQNLEREKEKAEVEATNTWKNTVEHIESLLNTEEEYLEKNKNLHNGLKDDLKQNLSNRKEQLERLKNSKGKFIKRTVHRQMKLWKDSLFSQAGKGKGNFRIDRRAELAVYEALQEQLVAHKTRTGAPFMEKRIQRREMRAIANKWLKENGQKIIKSYETVRSWGVAKNKRSMQSKQHRGRGLFSHRKPKKNFVDTHMNIHYNRAHIKNYTRFFFAEKSKQTLDGYTLRRCFDDKAYLRCGTAEGFSRPKNKPLLIEQEKLELPSYDFPEKCGYIAPGVNLIIHDMEENNVKGRDTFSVKNVTVSVTCKPKLVYSSSATNWANDAYMDRLVFSEAHNIPKSGLQETRDVLTNLIFLKDSLKQFELMNIEKDYIKCSEGGDFLEREKTRLSVLITRILHTTTKLKESKHEQVVSLIDSCKELLYQLQHVEYKISRVNLTEQECSKMFKELHVLVELILKEVTALAPAHRPCDFQTTDAGPGVGTSERMVRNRLTESFLINDLDLLARFHYAPRDSKTHKVEQVMSCLNDALGDGRFVDIDQKSLFETYTEDKILQMKTSDFKKAQENQEVATAVSCAKTVSHRYEGTPCMFTTINSRVADKQGVYQHFYFDQKYAEKLMACSSEKAMTKCAGNHYYKFLENQFSLHFIRYKNGVEGIRNDQNFRTPVQINRIPAPVPNYETLEDDGSWHYFKLNEITEEQKQNSADMPNMFCPIVQLQKLVDAQGEPNVAVTSTCDQVSVKDKNETWEKISSQLDEFCEKYTGLDLFAVVRREAEKLYVRKLKQSSKKLQKMNTDELFSVVTGTLKLQIKTSSPIKALPWNGTFKGNDMTNTCTVDNMLFCCHVLLTHRPDIVETFRLSKNKIYNLLHQIHLLFKDSKFAEGKFQWIKQFPNQSTTSGLIKTWNMWGGENDFFFNKMSDTETVYTIKCSNPSCRTPVNLRRSRMVCFDEQARTLEEGITLWLENSMNRPCNNLDLQTNDRCTGSSSSSPRVFVNGSPLILPLDVGFCRWTQMPDQIALANTRYTIQAITYGNGGHFTSSIRIQNTWYLYDGLQEYHTTGNGITKQPKPIPPPTYTKSHAVYVKDAMQ